MLFVSTVNLWQTHTPEWSILLKLTEEPFACHHLLYLATHTHTHPHMLLIWPPAPSHCYPHCYQATGPFTPWGHHLHYPITIQKPGGPSVSATVFVYVCVCVCLHMYIDTGGNKQDFQDLWTLWFSVHTESWYGGLSGTKVAKKTKKKNKQTKHYSTLHQSLYETFRFSYSLKRPTWESLLCDREFY